MALGDFSKYIFNNVTGNSTTKTWNVLPAILSTWSNIIANRGNETSYSLYKQQALEYVNNAERNAELIKNQGEISLRNLSYKHKLEQGEDLAKVGARGGHLSGSNLAALIQKEKIRKMDEQTLRAGTTISAMQEIVNGYKQAYITYGTLKAHATSNKYANLASIAKGLQTYFELEVKDYSVIKEAKEKQNLLNKIKENQWEFEDKYYGLSTVEGTSLEGDRTLLSPNLFSDENTTTTYESDLNIIPSIKDREANYFVPIY